MFRTARTYNTSACSGAPPAHMVGPSPTEPSARTPSLHPRRQRTHNGFFDVLVFFRVARKQHQPNRTALSVLSPVRAWVLHFRPLALRARRAHVPPQRVPVRAARNSATERENQLIRCVQDYWSLGSQNETSPRSYRCSRDSNTSVNKPNTK